MNRYRPPNQGRLRQRHTNELESSILDTPLDAQSSTVNRGYACLMSLAHTSPFWQCLRKWSLLVQLLALWQCGFFLSFTGRTWLDRTLTTSVTLRFAEYWGWDPWPQIKMTTVTLGTSPKVFPWVSHVTRCRKTTRLHHPAKTSISEMGAWITLLGLTPFVGPGNPTAYNGMWTNYGNGRLNQRVMSKGSAPSVYTFIII